MINTNTIYVIDSWNLSIGIIVSELQHQLPGLATGLVIKSETTGKEWKVKTRLLFHHTVESQKKFLNEATILIHSSFGSVENMTTSQKMILDKEEENIFQYQLQPVDHNSEPLPGDVLVPMIV